MTSGLSRHESPACAPHCRKVLRCITPSRPIPIRRWCAGWRGAWRSEEHTSELQSLMRISYAVFCLKKQNTTSPNAYPPDYNHYNHHIHSTVLHENYTYHT